MKSIKISFKIISKVNHKSFKYVDRMNRDAFKDDKLNKEDLNELRRIRILDKKCWSIFEEVFIYIVFLMVLYQVAFSNLSSSSMQYNLLFQNTFVKSQSKTEIGIFKVSKQFLNEVFCKIS